MFNQLGSKRDCKACGRAGLWRFPPVIGRTFFCAECGAVQAGLNTTSVANTIKLHDLAGDPDTPVNGEIWRNGTNVYVYSGGSILEVGASAGDGVPSGVIAMWHGALGSVPSGWVLCTGASSTPDLRNKFIYGWTDSVAPGGTGGSETHLHASGGTHQHSSDGPTTHSGDFTHSNAGSHQHDNKASFNTGSSGDHLHSVSSPASPGIAVGDSGFASATSTNGAHVHSVSAHQHTSDGSHGSAHGTHSVNAHSTHRHDSIGGHQHDSISNLPPYYKMAFIMKS